MKTKIRRVMNCEEWLRKNGVDTTLFFCSTINTTIEHYSNREFISECEPIHWVTALWLVNINTVELSSGQILELDKKWRKRIKRIQRFELGFDYVPRTILLNVDTHHEGLYRRLPCTKNIITRTPDSEEPCVVIELVFSSWLTEDNYYRLGMPKNTDELIKHLANTHYKTWVLVLEVHCDTCVAEKEVIYDLHYSWLSYLRGFDGMLITVEHGFDNNEVRSMGK